jgi:hypothetical protein
LLLSNNLPRLQISWRRSILGFSSMMALGSNRKDDLPQLLTSQQPCLEPNALTLSVIRYAISRLCNEIRKLIYES